MLGPALVIANLEAGTRKVRSAVGEVERALSAAGVEHAVKATAGPGDATRLAREELAAGGRYLVAVGGDGTVHEVVNGMLDADRPAPAGAVLGVVAAGSGCDFVRTFDLPAKPAEAAARLVGDEVRTIDACRLTCTGPAGQLQSRYFANIAEAGLGAAVATRALRLPRRLGQSRYLAAFWLVLPGYQAGPVRVEVDGAVAHEGRAVNVVVANCRYFGGGMQISPRSDPADGLLDGLVLTGRKTDSFTMLPKIYKGSHLPHRSITEVRGHRLRIEPEQPVPVEADGEVLGTTPVEIEVVPGALTLKV